MIRSKRHRGSHESSSSLVIASRRPLTSNSAQVDELEVALGLRDGPRIMPTAKEVDNRPVAMGKWPRTHPHPLSSYERPKRKCGMDHCVHKYGNICLDVLLRPELLQEIYADKGIFCSSPNPLLEFCLDGGHVKDVPRASREDLCPLLQLCSDGVSDPSCGFDEKLERICQSGCDIHVQSSQGFTALHFLINGCGKVSFPSVLKSTSLFLSLGFDVGLQDAAGDTVLCCLANLLQRRLFDESTQLARMLLCQPGINVNHVNRAGRSLLSHCVTYGDEAADLTRLLLNHGAQVKPFTAIAMSADQVATERHQSAFTWLLRSLISRQVSLNQARDTLRLLCEVLAMDGERMRSHVLSTMLHVGQQSGQATSPHIASLFIELKGIVSPYWLQPLTLRQMCLHTIRKSIGPKNVAHRAQELNLPLSLRSYVHLQ